MYFRLDWYFRQVAASVPPSEYAVKQVSWQLPSISALAARGAPSEYVVRQVGWQLLDGNSSRLKIWGYSAGIPAEMLKFFSRREEREKKSGK